MSNNIKFQYYKRIFKSEFIYFQIYSTVLFYFQKKKKIS